MKEPESNCHWCRKALERGESTGRTLYYDSRFCDASCRYAYHNAKKKIKRQAVAAMNAAIFVQEMLLKDGELAEQALEYSRQIMGVSSLPEFEIKCSYCGQGRMYIPYAGEKCSFCQREAWQFQPKKKNPIKE